MKRKWLALILTLVLIITAVSLWFWGHHKVNEWFAPLIVPSKTTSYEIGQWVPIGPEPKAVIHPDGLDGYLYRVNSYEIVDTATYLQEKQLENPWQEGDLQPEKLMLVNVTIANESNGKKALSLYQIDLQGKAATGNLNAPLCAELNEDVESNAVFPGIGGEVTVTLPFELHSFSFSSYSWRNIADYPFHITCHVTNEGWEKRIVPLEG